MSYAWNIQKKALIGIVFFLLSSLLFNPGNLARAQGASTGLQIHASGQYFFRWESRTHYTGDDHQDMLRHRMAFRMTTSDMEIQEGLKLAFRFTPQLGGYWTPQKNSSAAEFGVYEAAAILTGKALRWEVGRFELRYGDQLVLTSPRWSPHGRTYNGTRVQLNAEERGLFLDLFAVQTQEGVVNERATTDWLSGDLYLLGAYGGLHPAKGALKTGEIYLLSHQGPADAVEAAHQEYNTGTRVQGALGALDYTAELGAQFGQRPAGDSSQSVRALGGHVEVGVALPMGHKSRIFIASNSVTGDDPKTTDINEGWNPIYSARHGQLGLTDYMGLRTNISDNYLGLDTRPSKRLRLRFNGHLFLRPHPVDDGPVYTGLEWESRLHYRLSSAFQVYADHAVFRPSTVGLPLAHYLEAGVMGRF